MEAKSAAVDTRFQVYKPRRKSNNSLRPSLSVSDVDIGRSKSRSKLKNLDDKSTPTTPSKTTMKAATTVAIDVGVSQIKASQSKVPKTKEALRKSKNERAMQRNQSAKQSKVAAPREREKKSQSAERKKPQLSELMTNPELRNQIEAFIEREVEKRVDEKF